MQNLAVLSLIRGQLLYLELVALYAPHSRFPFYLPRQMQTFHRLVPAELPLVRPVPSPSAFRAFLPCLPLLGSLGWIIDRALGIRLGVFHPRVNRPTPPHRHGPGAVDDSRSNVVTSRRPRACMPVSDAGGPPVAYLARLPLRAPRSSVKANGSELVRMRGWGPAARAPRGIGAPGDAAEP